MRRFSQREGLQTLSEINVTPMLDLCFVLLVIFMITTPLLESSSELALPSSGATSNNPVDPDKVHTVAIDRNEAITLDGLPFSLGELRERLETLHRDKPDAAVVIRPHKELTVQKLVGVMDALRAARIGKVGIVTEQSGGGAP